MLNTNEFDIHPVQTWHSLFRRERAVLLVFTIIMFGFSAWFIWFVASASL